jgi:hypothetical protein
VEPDGQRGEEDRRSDDEPPEVHGPESARLTGNRGVRTGFRFD